MKKFGQRSGARVVSQLPWMDPRLVFELWHGVNRDAAKFGQRSGMLFYFGGNGDRNLWLRRRMDGPRPFEWVEMRSPFRDY